MNVYVINLANNLGVLGHKVDIYTRVHKSSEMKVLQINNNVRLIHLSSDLSDHYKNTEKFAQILIAFIKNKSLQYDIIHAHYFYSGLVGLVIKKHFNIPLIMTFHTLGEMKKFYAKVVDIKRIRAEKQIILHTDKIIASTELEQNEIIHYYNAGPKNLTVIYPGVNHDIFKPYGRYFSRKKLNLPLKKKLILFVGRIDPVKGLVFFIESLVSLTIQHPEFARQFRVLLIGGDIKSREFWLHPEIIKLKKIISREHMDCCIKFLGSRPHNQLPFYYSAADVVVMPSVYESFGLVVLEAMASGSCVLATRVGGLSLLIRDKQNGRLFSFGNSSEFNSVLWELIHDTVQRDKLGRQAYITSQDYCWDKQALKIINIYNKLI